MRKRIISLFLAVVLVFSVIPVSALAAVRDLLGNDPAVNQAILNELDALTGGSGAEAAAVLEQYGLLDENGQLNVDETINLNGEAMTLDEIMALLENSSTDLTEVGYVDGTPIALGDLKTIVEIEQELKRIQETYFSDRTFSGEAVENLNSLLDQMETSGISLQSEGASGAETLPVFDEAVTGPSSGYYWKASNAGLEVGDSLRVYVKAVMPEAMRKLCPDETEAYIVVQFLSNLEEESNYILETAFVKVNGNASLLAFTADTPLDEVYLRVSYNVNPVLPSDADWSALSGYSFGTLWSGVSFYGAEGFAFEDPSGKKSDAFNCFLDYSFDAPAFKTTWQDVFHEYGNDGPTGKVTIPMYIDEVSKAQMEGTIAYLNACKDVPAGSVIQASTRFAQGNDRKINLMCSLSMFQQANQSSFTVLTDHSSTGFPINILSSSETDPDSTTITFDFTSKQIPTSFDIPYCNSTTGTTIQNDVKNTWWYTMAYWSEYELLNDNDNPTLTVSAPAGEYQSGDLIPIQITADEYIQRNDNAAITINGESYLLSDLHASSSGKFLSLLYEVQPFDTQSLIISLSSDCGITDIFGNPVNEVNGVTLPDITLVAPLVKNAPTGLTASAFDDSGITFTVTADDDYAEIIANYDDGKTTPFQVVVNDGSETHTLPVAITEDGTFVTDPLTIARKQEDATYLATLQVNEGSKKKPDWVDIPWITAAFTVPAYVNVDSVEVTADKADVTELSLGDAYRPVLTATVNGENGQTPTDAGGTWSSSNEAIATLTENADGTATVVLTGEKLGEVTFTFTADNGTEEEGDDKSNTITYTVVAGDSLALVIPTTSATIVTRKEAAATVLWSSNASQFAPDKDFTYTIQVYEGYAETEADLAGKTLVKTYEAGKDKNSVTIEEDVLSALSEGSDPAYTVLVSMPHPNAGSDEIKLTAMAWIVVQPVPAKAVLARPESTYLLDDAGSINIGWAVENRDTEATGQDVTLTVIRVQEDNTSTTVYSQSPGVSTNGSYNLTIHTVKDNYLKDTYQIMLTVENPGDAPSTDSFPLYVYNADALTLQDSEGNDLPDTLTLNNTSKVSGDLPTDTAQILALRQELGLIEYVNINYQDYNWNTYLDGIAWVSSNDSVVSVNYKQGGLYENINRFGYDTYRPGTTMALSATVDGTATITATHAKTGMKDSVTVDVTTLREKFYLFQFSPAMKTTVKYIDGKGVEKTVYTNDDGVLALYEPDHIASDVWLSAEASDGTEYMGTIYLQNLQSGEQDATKLQLYPLNTLTLREAAKAELTLVKSDGAPLANTDVTVRGGVFKNGSFCETAGIGKSRGSVNAGGANQTDTIFTTDSTGKIVIYFDATQFWSAAAGENTATALLSTDQIQYALEIRNIADNAYYPVFQTVNANINVDQEIRTASGVVVLDATNGETNKPFVAQQVVDYGLQNGRTIDVRKSTGKAGPTRSYPTATLKTTMLLWGEDASAARSYQLQMADENGYIPAGQTSSASRYPFSSIPVVENTITLSADTMTSSGWIANGKDMGIKTRLTKSGSLVRELTMPFRVMDLTRVTPVDEDENVTQMLVTLKDSSIVNSATFQSGGNDVVKGITNVLGKISGPVNSSVFKMIITPSDDPTVFNALIWAGYDNMDLEDVDYDQNGISFETDYLNQELEVGVPGVGDLASMAQGTYNPAQSLRENASKMTSTDAELKLQLTGYYEAEIRYNMTKGAWEIFTTGGGFTAGVGMEIGFTANAMVGPVPVTGSFSVGGALQLDFKTAVRYSQQGNDVWSDPDATAVSDYLTNLRINAYVEAFGGFGFDFAVVALKIGLYGKLSIDSQNKFLSRTYLADSGDRQLQGNGLKATGEVGIKFVAKFLFISYEAKLASAGFSATQKFNQWDAIENYWNSATSGLSASTLQLMAAQSGMEVTSASATLQSRDYLETFARSWGSAQSRIALFSLDTPSALQSLQTNANPDSYPELSDDGQIFAYISDSESGSIYESRAHYSVLTNSSYAQPQAIANPTDFTGYGDSNVDIAGSKSFAAAAFVRLASDLPGKDANDKVSVEEQNLLMNGAEIVASVYNGMNWTSTRLTANGTPDLAPVVASNGEDSAVVFWRSVYNANPNNPLDFQTKDTIYYSYYKDGTWSEAKPLYNGSNGSVKALEAAMLPDGTAMAVYTLDKSGTGDTTTYEVGYTMVSSDGTLGSAMLVTSDSYLDENPQVVTANFGTADKSDRFVLAWHSLRDGMSDIQLLAVDSAGVMSNSFPASLSEITMDGSAAVGSTFRLATLSGSYRDVTNLTILWSETVDNDHSVLRAARLRSNGSAGYVLSSPMELATLPNRTMADHFAAYVSGSNEIKAIIQATQYGETIDAQDQTFLYTATSHFATDAVEIESIGVDYENLTLNSLTPVQFVIRNTGLNNVTGLTVTMGSGETATLNTALLPNQSATLTVYHKIGETVTDASYSVTASGGIRETGKVYFDYPDLGISRMEVMAEEQGQRTIGMTLFNAAAATLAGKNRAVKLAFYLDEQHTKPATVTCTTTGVSVSGNVLTITDPDALARIDDGSFSLEVTYDLGSYVQQTLQKTEVPSEGVYLFADLYAEGNIGNQTETVRLPEYYSSDNLASLLLTGAYARTGKKSTLTVDLSAGENGNTAAAITLKNNSLQTYTGEKQMATLLSASGEVLETKALTIPTNLSGETSHSETVQFTKQGARVLLTTLVEGEDQLTFDGLPVTLEDFVPAKDENGNVIANTYTYELSGVDLDNLVITAYSGTGAAVTINGEAVENGAATSVRINPPETTITVVIGEKTYILKLTDIPSGSTSTGSYRITVKPSDHGTVSPSRTTAGKGGTVTLTVTPDEGYRLEKLTVKDASGNELKLVDQGEGRYSFTMPDTNVTVEASFVLDDGAGLPFTDVAVGDWYYDAVAYVYENGLMTGTSGTLFSPNATTTRAMIVTILYRLEGSPVANGSAGFTDVAYGTWYTAAVNWAAANDIVTGYGSGKFGPMDPITREQMAAILFRYADFKGMDTTARADLSGYTDAGDISAYAVEAMSWANAEGFITGTTATTLKPQGSATRAQVATILTRYAQKADET